MNRPLTIDIDRLVLSGVDVRRPGALRAIESAVQRSLVESTIDPDVSRQIVDAPVARDVATSVIKAVGRGMP